MAEFFVDISRREGTRFEHFIDMALWDWELREGEMDNARLVYYEGGVRTNGRTLTAWGARRAARKAKKRVLRWREQDTYLPRESVK